MRGYDNILFDMTSQAKQLQDDRGHLEQTGNEETRLNIIRFCFLDSGDGHAKIMPCHKNIMPQKCTKFVTDIISEICHDLYLSCHPEFCS